MTFTGVLIDQTCTSSAPIKCMNGTCVDSYEGCLFAISKEEEEAFNKPVVWGNTDTPDSPCQVFCNDGSCRDKQEHCPLILGCSDPLKPYKCRIGFCAKNQAECIRLYGEQIEKEDVTIPSAYCQAQKGSIENKYFRCEDGICRTGIWN